MFNLVPLRAIVFSSCSRPLLHRNECLTAQPLSPYNGVGVMSGAAAAAPHHAVRTNNFQQTSDRDGKLIVFLNNDSLSLNK